VTVGTERSQLWWRWEDPADAVAAKVDLHIAVTPPFFAGERFFAIAAQYALDCKLPLKSTSFPLERTRTNEGHRMSEPPLMSPVGQAVCVTPGKHEAILYATDADTKSLWRTSFHLPNLAPRDDAWKQVQIVDGPLTDPTDVAALTDGRLIVADAGRILLLEPDGDGFATQWSLDRWGDDAERRLGAKLRLAADSPWMLVSDVQRHRVLWFDWSDRRLLAQLDTTDQPGSNAKRFDMPTLVSLCGTRAVVADSGNQRVVKIEPAPAGE